MLPVSIGLYVSAALKLNIVSSRDNSVSVRAGAAARVAYSTATESQRSPPVTDHYLLSSMVSNAYRATVSVTVSV